MSTNVGSVQSIVPGTTQITDSSGGTESTTGTLTGLTDSSGGTVGSTIAETLGRQTLTFHINLATITGAGDVVTTFTPGFAGTIESLDFIVGTPVTTGSKAATLNAEIGTTNVTGGAVALTSANCTPLGAEVAGSAVTATNTFTASDTISIEAASVTAFSEGDGTLIVTLSNDDLRNAIASINDTMNDYAATLAGRLNAAIGV